MLLGAPARPAFAQVPAPAVTFSAAPLEIAPGASATMALGVLLTPTEYFTAGNIRHFDQTLVDLSGTLFSGNGSAFLLPGPLPAGVVSYSVFATFSYPDSGYYQASANGLVSYQEWIEAPNPDPLVGGTFLSTVTYPYPFNFSQEISVLAAAAIPEPEACSLLMASLGLLGFLSRKRRRAAS